MRCKPSYQIHAVSQNHRIFHNYTQSVLPARSIFRDPYLKNRSADQSYERSAYSRDVLIQEHFR